MGTFTPLRIEIVNGSDHGRQLWRLAEPLTFTIGLKDGGISITVPAGTLTDFASVPRVLWPLFPPTGKWCQAAVVHDWLCRVKGFPRFLADAIFREAMRRSGVPTWRRVIMFYAVRCYSIALGLKTSTFSRHR